MLCLNDIDFSLLLDIMVVWAKDYLHLASRWDLEIYTRLAKIGPIDSDFFLTPKLILTLFAHGFSMVYFP